jgi:hypothetical protein
MLKRAWLLALLLLLQQLSAAVAVDRNLSSPPNDPSYVSPDSAAARQRQEAARQRSRETARAWVHGVSSGCMQWC